MSVAKQIAWTMAGIVGILFLPVLLPFKVDNSVIDPVPVFMWSAGISLVVLLVLIWIPTRFSLRMRMAWSVGWGLLAALLCVLWVRSYLGAGDHVVIDNWMYASGDGYI